MPYSYYEIYITSLRALTAMGFPYGADEDAAFMITWLELHNLDGIHKLVELSNQINQKFEGKINLEDIKSKKYINLFNHSLLMKGPGLFDYLYQETKKKEQIEIILENCEDPTFIIPLSERFSNKLEQINACWIENNKKLGMKSTEKKILIGELKDNIKIFNNQVLLQLSLKNNNKISWRENLDIIKIKYEINSVIEQKQLEKSLSPNSKHWDILSKLAHKTFVPASDESRNRGAGGGSDND